MRRAAKRIANIRLKKEDVMLRACIVAFAMYSKIPMPRVEWNEKSMKYALCFFPLIGAVIGGLELLYMEVSQKIGYGRLVQSCIMAVIPIIVTGGIHMDGYMDTMDALHSYQEKEKKLAILKDVHIGAFAGIMLVSYYLVYVGVLSELDTIKEGLLLAIGFLLSRTLSGLALVFFPAAKKTGTLYSFAVTADRNKVRFVLMLWLIISFLVGIFVDWKKWIGIGMGNILLFLYYKWKSEKEFGGITGDLAGWFLALSELVTAIVISL